MSHISKPVDWEVFNIPPVQPVQYYSILKKRREFSQLIKQYDAQIFRRSYLHYCGIVPKNINSSLSNKYEIFIAFLDETPNTSFIGFRVKVSKETFIYESNLLLLFLKKSKKAVFYSMNNNRIHVKCRTNAWELFYLLYDNYLRRYVLTIIGTQFFYHFVYSYCIEKEKQLLEMLYKGSKVIHVSKMSIYYKIHRKRKISITDLIHMTLNMPKRKKYKISYFGSKESILYSDMNDGDFYTAVGNKISVSKLFLRKFKKEHVLPEKHSQKLIISESAFKRKFDEIDNSNPNLDAGPSFEHFKTQYSCPIENQWKQYQNLKPYRIKSYSNIPFINPLVPNLLKNGNSSFNSSSCLINAYSHLPSLITPGLNKDGSKNLPIVQETCELRDHVKSSNNSTIVQSLREDNCKNSKSLISDAFPCEKKSFDLGTHLDCIKMPKVFSSHKPTLHSNKEKLYSCINNSDLIKNCDSTSSISFPSNIDINKDACDIHTQNSMNFTTATGKTINISAAAMLKAHQLIENEQIFHDKVTSNPLVKHKMSAKNIYLDSSKKTVTGVVNFSTDLENKYSREISSTKNNEYMPKNIAAVESSSIVNFKQDIFDAADVTFATAAGKTLNISNAAMESAKTIIQSAIDEEKKSLSSENLSTQKNIINKNIFHDIGCSSKSDDVNMDKTFVEKFFEDVQFDEKELELTDNSIKNDNLGISLESKSDNNLSTHKPRKSLGGRRSMRYCSDKL